MWMSVESVQGGFIIEVRTERGGDPTFLVQHINQDWKKVVTTYQELEEYFRDTFQGKKFGGMVPTVVDHGKKTDQPP